VVRRKISKGRPKVSAPTRKVGSGPLQISPRPQALHISMPLPTRANIHTYASVSSIQVSAYACLCLQTSTPGYFDASALPTSRVPTYPHAHKRPRRPHDFQPLYVVPQHNNAHTQYLLPPYVYAYAPTFLDTSMPQHLHVPTHPTPTHTL
jgi:hypothetical protein